MKNRKAFAASLPQVLLLPLLLWLVWSADLWTAVSLMYPAYLFVALISLGLLLLPWAWVRRPSTAVVPCLWIATLVALPFVPNSSLKPLLWGARSLEEGMDRETVMRTLADAYAGTPYPAPIVHSEEDLLGKAGGPTRRRLLIKPQGRDPGFQAESLLVFFENGQFTRASFSPD